jgi:hypothetical protein
MLYTVELKTASLKITKFKWTAVVNIRGTYIVQQDCVLPIERISGTRRINGINKVVVVT